MIARNLPQKPEYTTWDKVKDGLGILSVFALTYIFWMLMYVGGVK